jgi:hypothetical protein
VADLVLIADGQDASGAGEAQMFFEEGNIHCAASRAARGGSV